MRYLCTAYLIGLFALSLFIFSTGCRAEDSASSSPDQEGVQIADLNMGSGAPSQAQQLQPPPQKQALASTEGEYPDTTAEITELKRTSGETVTLKFTIINNSGKDLDFGYNFGESSITDDYNSVGGVHLIDPQNKKKYFVVRDTAGKCLCSKGLKGVPTGSKTNLWAKFPAPPVSVSKISVEIPHFIPMDDVPLG
ncbi:MAG: hypothetical protein DCC75_08760 [Proteobacteria bacterium]|nr:MAG: hypothetical protein DCC75_08760 [Pseudomonadota bacterium]